MYLLSALTLTCHATLGTAMRHSGLPVLSKTRSHQSVPTGTFTLFGSDVVPVSDLGLHLGYMFVRLSVKGVEILVPRTMPHMVPIVRMGALVPMVVKWSGWSLPTWRRQTCRSREPQR